MKSFAIYRLPHQKECTLMIQHEGDPAELMSCTELTGKNGFVVAPFAISPRQPILLIQPEEVLRLECVECGEESGAPSVDVDFLLSAIGSQRPPAEAGSLPSTSPRQRYHIDFSNFHANLLNGEFQKIVLSRCSYEERTEEMSPMVLFRKACELYPRMFISLVYTPKSGMWLTATPEILLEGKGSQWRTIALAGTMRYVEDPKWDIKNIQEQRFVATYLMRCLEHFSHQITEDGPYTARAANLIHLRSDFNFVLEDMRRIGELIRALHPTPAVCGLPKQQTFDFICRNESFPRLYYSGFSGPFNPEDDTHLFVSLRCMRLLDDCCHLYAGGGLLKDSKEEEEWEETEAKLETMRLLLDKRTGF